MNCKQVKKSLRYGYSSATNSQQAEMEAHARFCKACGRELSIDRLMNTLVNSHSNSMPEESPWDEVRVANRIKSRIQEMNERGNGSWDTAIIAVRGWLLAFGAAAVLLLVLTNQLPATISSNLSEQSEQSDRDQVSLTSPLMSEEIVSNNSPLTRTFGEDPEHAQ